MDFRRGFFRVWIVLAILWVGASTAYLWRPMFGGGEPSFEHWYTFDWAEKARQLGPLDEEFQQFASLNKPLPPGIVWTTLRSKDLAYHLMHAEGIDPADLAASVAVVQADLDELQAEDDRARREALPFMIGVIVLPPLLLLCLGSLFGWIAAGFRRAA